MNPCFKIYSLSDKPVYGNIEGVCRITGEQSTGVIFEKWVRDTFTDIGEWHIKDKGQKVFWKVFWP